MHMNPLLNPAALKSLHGDYQSGNAASVLSDAALLQTVRRRRRQLGRMMLAYDIETAKQRLPDSDYVISKKVDGEYTCLYYSHGEAFTLNPGGTIRCGAPLHLEAAEVLQRAGVTTALLAGELYTTTDSTRRPRVHDIVRLARAPQSDADVESLNLALFNVYELDGDDLSMQHEAALAKLGELFSDAKNLHPVEWIKGDRQAIFDQFDTWVQQAGEEGIVIRSDSSGIFKIKPKHSLDLAIIGFSEGIDDRAGMLHSLLLAVVRSDGDFHLVGRVGGGFSDAERRELLQQLRAQGVESDYTEVNSDRVAYQMLKPGLVAEISCLDIVSRTSHGNTIDRMIVEWNEEQQRWTGIRRLPLCSIISPQFVRLRDDKQPDPEQVAIKQLSSIAEIPDAMVAANDVALPASTILQRVVATKTLKGAELVRKLVCWKTNKEEKSRDFPAYVLHLTDYSPNRKQPLIHDICVSESETQIRELFDAWAKRSFVRGWKKHDG